MPYFPQWMILGKTTATNATGSATTMTNWKDPKERRAYMQQWLELHPQPSRAKHRPEEDVRLMKLTTRVCNALDKNNLILADTIKMSDKELSDKLYNIGPKGIDLIRQIAKEILPD